MAFSIKKHLQTYNKQKEDIIAECTTCSADIAGGNAAGHAELMKIKAVLERETSEMPEGYDVYILTCCADTAQDQVVFAITNEFSYRDKAEFARLNDDRKIHRITHQAPHIRFTLSKNCDTLVSMIDVPSASGIVKAIPFMEDYTEIVNGICEQYLSMVFQVKEIKQNVCPG